jgi:hypothetical protein
VFVYSGRLDPPEPVPAGGGWLSDNDTAMWVEWRPLAVDESSIPLYPNGVEKLVADLVAVVRD